MHNNTNKMHKMCKIFNFVVCIFIFKILKIWRDTQCFEYLS